METPTNSSFISNLIGTVEYSTIPAGTVLLFGLLGLLWRPNAQLVSAIQHLSAGVVTSVVAVELVPILLKSFEKTLLDYIAVVVGFSVAVVCLSILSYFLPCQCDDDCGDGQGDSQDKSECCKEEKESCEKKKKQSCEQKKSPCCKAEKKSCEESCKDEKESCKKSESPCHKVEKKSCNQQCEATLLVNDPSSKKKRISTAEYLKVLPWLMLAPVAVDTFLDGILLGLTYVGRPQAGLVIAVGFAFETAILGIMTSSTLQLKGFPLIYPVIIIILFAILFFVGGIIGATIFSQGQGTLFLAFISFGVGALLFLVTDDLLIEAREKKSVVTWYTKFQFFVGFLAVLLVHEALE